MPTNEIGVVVINSTWSKLEDLIKAQINPSFSFVEGITYRLQNISPNSVVYRESATTPASVLGGIIRANTEEQAEYKVGANPCYVHCVYDSASLYISTKRDL